MNNTGRTGEDIALRFLTRKGYDILETNARRLNGEIDIIAKDGSEIVFVEVKTISSSPGDVPREMYRPEWNVDDRKLSILTRTANIYMSALHLKECDWRIDVIGIVIDQATKRAVVRHLKRVAA